MNIEFLQDAYGNEVVLIDNGDGSFTSMLKSTWDKLEAQKELGETL